MSESREDRVERVCVALDAASSGREALDAAANLAAELDAELAGFFIEDVNVLRAAALPFTREMGLASGVSRPMQLEEIERALRTQAQAAQSSLAQIAGELQLRWSFTTVRGTGIAPMLATAGRMNLTVVAPRSSIFHSRARSIRRASERSRSTERPVAVLFDGSEQGLRAVRAAAVVASSRSAPLMVLLCARSDRDATAFRETLEETAARDTCNVRYARLTEGSPTEIAAAARRVRAAAMLVGSGPGMGERQLTDLLERLDCPLMVLSR